jgi:hypothetical protein
MSILTATRLDVKPTTLLIKGLVYSVSKIDPGEEGTAAFRLDKVHGEGVYDVVRTHDGRVVCDCPSYVMTFERTASTCKHGRALVESGYLDRPSLIANVSSPRAVPSKPAVAPITRKDQVRASYFGLKLPTAPAPAPAPIVVVEASTPIVEVLAPAVVAELLPDEPQTDDDLPESGKSWQGFNDDSQWELGPEVAPIVEAPAPAPTPSTASLADRLWMAETTALLITLDALNGVEWADSAEGRDFDPDAVFDRLEPENQAAFHSYLKMIGEPVATFHDWVDLCWAGSPVSFPEPGPRPTRLGRFLPSLEEDAERLGFELGNAGKEARPTEGRSFAELVAFYGGFLAGRAELEAEYEAWLASVEADRERMDDVFGSPEATWPESELAEARAFSGHPAYEN